MPLLPTQNINTNAVDMGQGPSVSRAGQVWDQVSKVGSQIQSFGEELAAKRKQSETLSYISSNKSALERFKADKQIELEAKYPGDPTGAASEFLEAMNTFGEDSFQNAPNDDAKEIWSQEFAARSNDAGIQINNWEHKKRVNHQRALVDDNIYKDQQHLAAKPDPNTAMSMLNNHLETLSLNKGILFSDEEALEKGRKTGASITSSLMDGMIQSKQYEAALSILDGKHPHSKTLLSNMSPNDIGSTRAKAMQLMKARNEFSKSIFNMEAGDISMALQEGRQINKGVIENLVSRSAALKPDERKVFMDNLNSDLQYNQALNELKTMPIEEVDKLTSFSVSRDENDVFNFKARTEKQERFQKAAKDLLDKRKNKAPEFHVENDREIENLSQIARNPDDIQGVKAYTKSIVAKQSLDKVSNPKIMTKEMAVSYGSLLSSKSAEMQEKAYQALRQGMQVGDTNYARNAISDMIEYKAITPVQGMALSLENEASRKSALANIANKKEIESQYDSFKKSTDLKEDANDILADSSVNEFKKAIQSGGRGNISVLNGFDEMLTLEYKAARLEGLSSSKSKTQAISKVLKNNFAVARQGNSQVILGAEHIKHKDDVQDFMRDSLDKKVLSETFKVSAPTIYKEKMGLINREDLANERYLNELSGGAGEWVTNKAQNGAVLYKRMSNGGRSIVRDSEGNPVSVEFSKMKGLPRRKNLVNTREGF